MSKKKSQVKILEKRIGELENYVREVNQLLLNISKRILELETNGPITHRETRTTFEYHEPRIIKAPTIPGTPAHTDPITAMFEAQGIKVEFVDATPTKGKHGPKSGPSRA